MSDTTTLAAHEARLDAIVRNEVYGMSSNDVAALAAVEELLP